MEMGLVSGIKLIAWSWVRVGGSPFGSKNTSSNCFSRFCMFTGIS